MPIEARNDLTGEHLRHVLDYDEKTGILSWRYNPIRPKAWNTRFAGKPAGSPCGPNGTIQIRVDDVLYLAHRLIFVWMTGAWPTAVIDHINGDPADNRWENLRQATQGENTRNRKGPQKNNKSGFLGVRYRPHHGKWEARINFGGKLVWHQYADSAQEAAAARREAIPRYHGEFASRG